MRQAKLSELVPPPPLPPPPPPGILTRVNVGIGVRVGRRNITVAVSVGVGVSVLRGVEVTVAVGVDVGSAPAVAVNAAFAVWAMNVLTAPGTGVETEGAVKDGTHARISAKAVNQIRNFGLNIQEYLVAITRLQFREFNDGKSCQSFSRQASTLYKDQKRVTSVVGWWIDKIRFGLACELPANSH